MTAVVMPSSWSSRAIAPFAADTAFVGCGVLLVAAYLGAATAYLAVAPSQPAALVWLAGLAALAVLVGGRRVLVVAACLDVALQVDRHVSWDADAAATGALAGLGVSITTISVLVLYAWWAAEGLARAPGVATPAFRRTLLVVPYLILCVVSLAGAADLRLSLYALAMLGQTYLLLLWVVSHVRTRPDVLLLAAVIAVTLLIAGCSVIAQAVTGVPAVDEAMTELRGSGRYGGTIGSPNTAGSVMAAGLPVAGALLLAASRRHLRVLSAGAVLAATVGLVLTQSRGAWLGALVGGSVLLLVAVSRRWTSGGVVVGVVLALGLVLLPFLAMVRERLLGDDAGSAEARQPLNELALRMISDHPLNGVGLNNVGVVLSDYAGPEFSTVWLYTVHNKYLLVAAEAGVPALLAFIGFLVVAVTTGWRLSHHGDRLLAVLGAAAACSVLTQLVQMPVDLFQSRPQVQQLWLVVSLAVTASAVAREPLATGHATGGALTTTAGRGG